MKKSYCKCWIIRILLCCLLGVVTTVGIAWWILWSWNPASALVNMTLGYSTEDRSGWFVILDDKSFGRLSIGMSPAPENRQADIIVLTDALPSWSMVHQPAPNERNYMIYEYASGWPNLALRYNLTLDADQTNPEWLISGGFPSGASPFLAADEFEKFRALPFIPIWQGFLIDTFIYSAIWFGLFFGIGIARRTIRNKRGCCLMCGYDLRSEYTKGCPECGWNRES